jgi:hypothetical protein
MGPDTNILVVTSYSADIQDFAQCILPFVSSMGHTYVALFSLDMKPICVTLG